MKTRIADLIIKSAAVAGLAAGLALGGGFGAADAQENRARNYFDTQIVPGGARTGVDAHDPYAPVDLNGSAIVAADAGNARAATVQPANTDDGASERALPPLPTLPGRPY